MRMPCFSVRRRSFGDSDASDPEMALNLVGTMVDAHMASGASPAPAIPTKWILLREPGVFVLVPSSAGTVDELFIVGGRVARVTCC